MCWVELATAVAGSALTKQSTPAVEAVAAPPSATDYSSSSDVTAAAKKARAKIAAASGYQSTIKTGGMGDTSAASTKKMTLGG